MSRFTPGLGVSGALGAVSAVLSALLWLQTERLDQAREDARLWEAGAESRLKALEELQAAQRSAEAALREHRARLDELSRKRSAERTTFKEARYADQQVGDWGRTVLPDAVAGLLGQEDSAARAASGSRASGADRADAASAAALGNHPQ